MLHLENFISNNFPLFEETVIKTLGCQGHCSACPHPETKKYATTEDQQEACWQAVEAAHARDVGWAAC